MYTISPYYIHEYVYYFLLLQCLTMVLPFVFEQILMQSVIQRKWKFSGPLFSSYENICVLSLFTHCSIFFQYTRVVTRFTHSTQYFNSPLLSNIANTLYSPHSLVWKRYVERVLGTYVCISTNFPFYDWEIYVNVLKIKVWDSTIKPTYNRMWVTMPTYGD